MKKSLFVVVCFVSVFLIAISGYAGPMKAGAAFRVVTPDPLLPVSGGVGEPEPVNKKIGDLFARALVLEKGDVRVAIVSVDFLGFPSVLCDKARAQIKGIPAENILIGSTHTHSAPDTYAFPDLKGSHGADLKYLDWVCGKVAEAVNEAAEKLQPVTLKIAVGEAKGKIAYNYYAPQLYDPRCGVIQAIAKKGKEKGKPIATLVNYAIHPEVIGNDQGIVCPDLCGPLYDRIQSKNGGMAIFMNSAQGGMVTADCRGPNGKDIQTWEECIRIGELLADEALRIVENAPVEENPSLICVSKNVPFPVESKLMQAIIAKSPLGYPMAADNTVTTRVNLVDIGTAQILTIPGEALPNIGYYVKRHMPTNKSFLFGLTNDAFGYMLAKVDWRSFKRYDYVSQTGLGENTGEIYMENALALIESSPKPDSEVAK
ncbi:MAG TPA: hypothetical protein PLI09_18980 [Candidatus Hydrogenedentes bacterium]|nr:hypothetical protein [Candidatus Hydrogenedentota bacterium]